MKILKHIKWAFILLSVLVITTLGTPIVLYGLYLNRAATESWADLLGEELKNKLVEDYDV